MLTTLRRIIQEVNRADDIEVALQIMVERVRAAVETQSSTIFLVDPKKEHYILIATDGLNPEMIGKVRLRFDEGLVGLVGSREEPINLEDAPAHPKFSPHPEVGEEKYRAFLGVPIIHHRRLLGVLTIQQEESRKFDESEESFLVTIAVHLAGIIAHAEVTGALTTLLHGAPPSTHYEEACLEGIPSAPGVGIGQPFIVYPPADLDAVPDRQASDLNAELELFNTALNAAREDVRNLGERLAPNLPKEELALFDVYLRILDGTGLGEEVIEEIEAGKWAQGALKKVVKDHIRQFEEMDDPYLRERAADIKDLGLRILSYLQKKQKRRADYPEQTILVGEEVTASALAEVPEGHLVGVVSQRGSVNSHVAILARALGVPTVMGVKGLSIGQQSFEERPMIVDGYYGQVYLNPKPNLLQQFRALADEEQEMDSSLEDLYDLPAVTPDGYHLSLFVNTGLAADASLSLTVGAEGVGLFRTEVPFMVRDSFPTEDEQRIIYRQLLNAFSPRPVIMRTLDAGGDKPLPYFPIDEVNPFLGWRGIRLTLDHPDIFLVQLRAMLKASEGFDNLRIMLPMISSLVELDQALVLIDQAYKEVCEEGVDVKRPPIGVMIEVPSAVYQAKSLARRVDFLSVGSNDLVQYILAVDRNNARVAHLYDAFHPAVLMALQHVVDMAHSEGKQVSICGEMASDPASVILLIAMGFDVLSMNSVLLPRIKWVIRTIPMKQAKELLEQALSYEDPAKIRFYLEQALDEAGLGGLIRAGK